MSLRSQMVEAQITTMATKEEIQALFTDDTLTRREKIHLYLKDQTVPFEDRLEIFITTPGHLITTSDWILEFPKFEDKYGRVDWHLEFHAERHEVIYLADQFDNLIYRIEHSTPYRDKWTKEKVDDFIREAVDTGIHAFTFDW